VVLADDTVEASDPPVADDIVVAVDPGEAVDPPMVLADNIVEAV
jgi:hypothetical protein